MSRPFLGPVVWPDFGNFRDYLWQELPESRDIVAGIEKESLDCFDESDIGTYGYLSEAFFWPLLSKALNAKPQDENLLRRYFDFIDVLLGSDDEYLVEAVGLNVSEALCGHRRWLEAARVFGGPLLKKQLAEIVTHPEWFTDNVPVPQDAPYEQP